jgi:hypothetical protein
VFAVQPPADTKITFLSSTATVWAQALRSPTPCGANSATRTAVVDDDPVDIPFTCISGKFKTVWLFCNRLHCVRTSNICEDKYPHWLSTAANGQVKPLLSRLNDR